MKVGEKYTESFKFDKQDIVKFSNLTGDTNPIHINDEYAQGTQFKKIILPGFLSASIFSKILGTTFPGEGTIYLNQSMNFLKPMYPDKIYTAVIKIKKINIEKSLIYLTTNIYINDDKTIEGEAIVQNKNKI
tara:strand:- start:966 stop:1361 length:396 start_codon:yes stop_codon:yes gene_type:complete